MKKQIYLQVKKSAIEDMLKRFEDDKSSTTSRSRLEGLRFDADTKFWKRGCGMKTTAAIDPGLSGACVVLENGLVVNQFIMPKVGSEFDLHGLILLLRGLKAVYSDMHIVIEDVHSMFGMSAGSNFTFGGICLAIEAIAATLCIPYTKVQPKAWQKYSFQGIPEIRKPSKIYTDKKTGEQKSRLGVRDCKAMALLAQKRLFPQFNALPTPRCSKPHDGLIDALLIGSWGERNIK